jgi:hypothetical protein
MKQCTKCKKEKDSNDFYKDTRYHGGLKSWCKQCNNENEKRKKSSFKTARTAIQIEENINKVKSKKADWAKIKVGNVIKGLKVIFKSESFMVLIDPKAPYRKITYTVNDFIVNTK